MEGKEEGRSTWTTRHDLTLTGYETTSSPRTEVSRFQPSLVSGLTAARIASVHSSAVCLALCYGTVQITKPNLCSIITKSYVYLYEYAES